MNRGGLARLTTVVVGLTIAASAYVTPARAARPHTPQVTITVWTAYTKGLLSAFTTLTNRFEQAYPSIKVDGVSSVSYTALFQKEQSAIFAGNPPTLAQAYENTTEEFTKSNAVEDLAPYINGKNGLSKADIKDFFAKDWADGLLGKTRYMMPFSKSDIVLYFNRAMLRAHHITSPPTTWTQFAADCKKLTVIQGGTAKEWCLTLQVPESDWYAWEYEWGNKVLDKNHHAAFATTKGAAPLSFFANLARKKEMVVSTTANYQDEADFDAGKTGFMMGTSAGLTFILAGARPGVETAVAKFPAGPVRRATELFGAPLIMFKHATAAEKAAGWLFMKWLTEPRQTAYWAENTGYMPVRHSAVKLMGSFYKKNPQQRASVEELDSSVVEPPYAGWDKASTDINTELLAALTGSKSPMAALRTAATQVNSDLAQH